MKERRSISVNDLFHQIRECSIPKIEIYNYVEELTDSFEAEKLKILLDDFEFYLFVEKEDMEGSFDNNDIIEGLNAFKKRGLAIPYQKSFDFTKDENGKPMIIEKEKSNVIDIEKLLFPTDFFCCYQFRNFLKKELDKANKTTNSPNKQLNKNKELKNAFIKLGFDELIKSNSWTESQTINIFKLLSENDLPYQIAFLDYLGVIKYIDLNYCKSKKQLYRTLATILNCPERAVRGNINVLNVNSKEDKNLYCRP
jgi:hypothetical protein